MRPRKIEVEGMAGMTRKQIRRTNIVANILIGKHGMCLDCAINQAVAHVWGWAGKPRRATFCSAACGEAALEFITDTLGAEYVGEVPIEQLPSHAH